MRDASHADGQLVLAAGFASAQGPREENQDFGGVHMGTALERMRQGVIAAVADGVSGGKRGRVAAELAVRALIEGFYAMPDTLGPARAMQAPLAAYNRWLHGMGRSDDMENAASTFTALALRGRRAHLVHVGDSRAWRFAGGKLTCLTKDHVRPEPDLRHVLIRALGIEPELRLDHATIELAEHDRLLLTSDGVHGPLSDKRIAAILGQQKSAEATAEELVEAALEAGGRDNATAVLIDVVRLPAPDHEGILAGLSALPAITPPEPGTSFDGFRIDRVLSEGRYAILLVAEDGEAGGQVVLKFPRPNALSERAIRLAFARELLLAQRVASPFVLAAHPVRPDRQTALYCVQPLLTGETMADRLAAGLPPLKLAVEHAIRLTRAVAALHRLEVVHRDIKPDNVMLTSDGGLKLIDLGVARLPRVEDFHGDEIPGTPGFMAPEQFAGNAGDDLTDQFALGVTLYRWLTGHWPFGEQEAFQRPRFGRPTPPSKYRAEIPSWLDDAVLTAIQPDREARFGDVIDLLRALERGGSLEVRQRRPVPLIERNPVRFWQAVSLGLALALALSLILR
ncbi:bifunctional protein-serine/threonine kinase/phosphatase [Novosphingobium sp. JCM 18896]|uniref:bifunctional protein-serine/threonine kinase/phosphatase n=1 Tax=Novosphingobium sp. JCM 18896 TaxID=2989731 RepID=UPI0022224F23|nr:bifunctional protein-serine/threonine kinase/phosphatase [Novosphingobium sp. JCM 18896]MCW1427562.1 protein phosphatase 2C domain-containing protein [Novosphingobium sp. JCM 18896]